MPENTAHSGTLSTRLRNTRPRNNGVLGPWIS